VRPTGLRVQRPHDLEPIFQLRLVQHQHGDVEGKRGEDTSGGLGGQGPQRFGDVRGLHPADDLGEFGGVPRQQVQQLRGDSHETLGRR
jgi:hypothetical protein